MTGSGKSAFTCGVITRIPLLCNAVIISGTRSEAITAVTLDDGRFGVSTKRSVRILSDVIPILNITLITI
ncbi:hypothetical protein HMPREF1141_3058 [Clostridium sp. MSTE9]|nr:hypothetical protein HMPREF1141_3058 [Clostridium sp. MSTE9]